MSARTWHTRAGGWAGELARPDNGPHRAPTPEAPAQPKPAAGQTGLTRRRVCTRGALPRLSALVLAAHLFPLPTLGATPYEAPSPGRTAYGVVTYGATKETYTGSALVSPDGHRAKASDFGEQGETPIQTPGEEGRNCLISRYEGIHFARCEPRSGDPTGGTNPTPGPGLTRVPGFFLIPQPAQSKADP